MNFVGARVGVVIDDIGVWGVAKGALGFRLLSRPRRRSVGVWGCGPSCSGGTLGFGILR